MRLGVGSITLKIDSLGITFKINNMGFFKKKKKKKIKVAPITGTNIKTITVNKKDYKDWPFVVDEVMIENHRGYFIIAIIKGVSVGLNGLAQDTYILPSAHDVKVAIVGKSVTSFINLGLELNNKK